VFDGSASDLRACAHTALSDARTRAITARLTAEEHFRVLAEPRRVVVAHCFRIAKRFEQRIGTDNLPLDQ
jgi:hypothetical protein